MNHFRGRRDRENSVEWRSYQISGSSRMLDGVEEVFRKLVQASDQNETQVVCAIFRGASVVKLGLQAFGSWEGEASEDESDPLPEAFREAPEFCAVVWIDRQS